MKTARIVLSSFLTKGRGFKALNIVREDKRD
jgi:hypothetical protein